CWRTPRSSGGRSSRWCAPRWPSGTPSSGRRCPPRSTDAAPGRASAPGVAPGDPLLDQAEVVVRAAHADREQARPRRDEVVGDLLRRPGHADGAFDLTRVAADVGAVTVEDLRLAPEHLDVAEAVPDGGVLGGVAQRLALPAAADQHGDVAGGGGVEPGPAGPDAGERLREVGQPAAGGAELVAVLVVVALEPARADAEDEPSAGDVVDGAGHVGEQIGVAVAVAAHQGAELDPGRGLGPRAEHRPALEVLAVGVAGQREEVVPVEHDVDPGGLGLGDGGADLRVIGVLRLQLDTDPDGMRHAVDRPTATRAAPSLTARDQMITKRHGGGTAG